MEKLLVNIANAWQKGQLKIVCLDELGPLADSLKANIDIYVIERNTSALQKTKLLAKYLSKDTPDIIHCHNLRSHILASIATLALKIPIVITKHGEEVHDKGILNLLNKFFLRRNKITVVSKKIQKVMSDWLKLPSRKIEIIENGVLVKPLKGKEHTEKPLDTVNFISVARLAPPKDFETLIKAWALVRKQYSNCKLTIIGDGILRPKLEELVKELRITDSVSLVGESLEVEAFLSKSDVFILSSYSEGLPMTILEAMERGLPILASNVGEVPNIIKNDVNGYVFKHQDDTEIAQAIVKIMGNPLSIKDMGLANRAEIERKYSINVINDRFDSIYSELT